MKTYKITVWQETNSGSNSEVVEQHLETTKKEAIKTAKSRLFACENADYVQIINSKTDECITIERSELK